MRAELGRTSVLFDPALSHDRGRSHWSRRALLSRMPPELTLVPQTAFRFYIRKVRRDQMLRSKRPRIWDHRLIQSFRAPQESVRGED